MPRSVDRLVTAESMLLGSPLHAVQWLAWKSFALEHPATTSSHRHWHSDKQRKLARGSAQIIVDGLSYRVAWV
ncbi:hypothetical protein HBH49_198440 [Parastagonospora nodorum]|nr:hypothetical protein HBH49_198440 [Parastagonospora nodorum]KAH5384395.1 hypothetical protein HBI33_099820 [Parastagonospora nodorum]